MKVRLFKPSVGREELQAVRDVFADSWLGLGPRVSEFEKAWAQFIGCKRALAVNSGTAALHLSLAGFRFPRGKKVLVPAITFISTASAALYNGLEPLFVDVDERTLGIDLQDLERKADKDCVAIMAVHMCGHPLPMDSIMEIAKARKLVVIEDCAHSGGGEYKRKKLGTWGDVGCFSFEEKKAMTTGDGGMLCSDNEELVDSLEPIRWVGIDKHTWKRTAAYTEEMSNTKHWYYEIHDIGYKYNMNDLCAAIGLVQMKKLDIMNASKRKAIKIYVDCLRETKHVRPMLPYDLDGNSAYWIFGVRTRLRDQLIVECKKKGIATGVHYTPLPFHPIFRHHKESIPVAIRVYNEIVTLPLFADITEKEVHYVADTVLEFDDNVDKHNSAGKDPVNSELQGGG